MIRTNSVLVKITPALFGVLMAIRTLKL